jgi:hypothetical protein
MSGWTIRRNSHYTNEPCLVEEVRFELTEPFGSSVFKTGAFSQALPLFRSCDTI